jgi:DNA-3-methyladenine glycosylase I
MSPSDQELERCPWALSASDAMTHYHDEEWGVPSRDERHLFEMITLEGAQAGLSWSTILNKREGYRNAFAGFDPTQVARFGPRDVERLLADPSIVRHRGKIDSTLNNARCVLALRELGSSLPELVWDLAGDSPIHNHWRTPQEVPAETELSRRISKELKKRGFRFVGPTTVYSFLQAVGVVDDHIQSCFRYRAR